MPTSLGSQVQTRVMGNEPSEREVFGRCGPSHLRPLDWSSPGHKKCVAASLVQGVYILERDRQCNRQGNNALAPIWWDYFGFQLVRILVDKDGSSFGAVFEPDPRAVYGLTQKPPPRYVLAFRGTVLKPHSRVRDLHLDLQLVLNSLTCNSRYRMAHQELQKLVSLAGPTNIWIAGHSLGAAIALQAGKSMAKVGCYIESYLFNPPFPPMLLEKIKTALRVTNSLVTAGVSHLLKTQYLPDKDPFLALCPWIPYIFVHPNDPISSEYIGYFEHREQMERLGLGGVGEVATRSSLIGLISGAIGRDEEATHLIPSAYVTKNMSYANDFKKAHGIHQWWQPHTNWNFQLHKLTR